MKTTSRTEPDIFEDLSRLCLTPGYIHVIAYFTLRDTVIRYREQVTADSMENLYGFSRLVRNEINFLLGLLAKQEVDYSLPTPQAFSELIEQTETLLLEFHHAISAEIWNETDGMSLERIDELSSSGKVMREAIFYGGEAAYSFQYRDLLILKYVADNPWLRANVGFEIEECEKVVRAVGRILNGNATFINDETKFLPEDIESYLPANHFTAQDVAHRTGLPFDSVVHILSYFTLPKGPQNKGFTKAQDFNQICARPLLKDGDRYYLFNIYNLTESAYQSPFYWMWDDTPYRDSISKNRGDFTEGFSERRLVHVFGRENVHAGVGVYQGKHGIGEIDILVIFGDRLIILEAKSKQLTIPARQGKDENLQSDFQAAVQLACDQASGSAKLILDGKITLIKKDKSALVLPKPIKRVYLMTVVSDHYPALTYQASQFLKLDKQDRVAAPYVTDVFHLDVLAEMLESPLYFLSYIDRRTGYIDKLFSSFEMTNLSYHLQKNLWIEEDKDRFILDDDISAPLDAAMLVRREGMPGAWTPDGIITRLNETKIGKIISQIEREANPAMIAFGFQVLTMSERAVLDISNTLDKLAQQTRQHGKNHDVSVLSNDRTAGITFMTCLTKTEKLIQRISVYCSLKKYQQKVQRWFGILINASNGRIEYGTVVEEEWTHDASMDKLAKEFLRAPSVDLTTIRKTVLRKKVGRNEPCTCGSGRKYKVCCLAKA
jgi:hypothetical protein